jgi:hypothetical protein
LSKLRTKWIWELPIRAQLEKNRLPLKAISRYPGKSTRAGNSGLWNNVCQQKRHIRKQLSLCPEYFASRSHLAGTDSGCWLVIQSLTQESSVRGRWGEVL